MVIWRSKKQSVVSMSAKSEFRVVAHGICELIWLKRILEELRIFYKKPMKLYYDNKIMINIAHNPIQHHRTKHVEEDYLFIDEKLEGGLVCMPYVPTKKQIVNVLIKGL